MGKFDEREFIMACIILYFGNAEYFCKVALIEAGLLLKVWLI